MFIVANKHNKRIVISDLKLVIKKKQVIDLDRLELPMVASKSKDLKRALSNGELIQMNRSKVKRESSKKPVPTNQDLFAQIKSLIKSELGKQKNQVVTQAADNSDVMSAIDRLTNLVESGVPAGTASNRVVDEVLEEMDIDEETLVEIHAKRLQRMEKTTDKSVEYNEEEIDNSSILENAEELEDLL